MSKLKNLVYLLAEILLLATAGTVQDPVDAAFVEPVAEDQAAGEGEQVGGHQGRHHVAVQPPPVRPRALARGLLPLPVI